MSPWQPFTALQDPTLSFSPCLIRPPHHLQRLNGIKYWWWCFAPRPYSPPFCSLCLWSPSSLSFSLPLVMLISLVFLLLPAHCSVMHFMMTLPHLSPHYSLFFSFHISFIYPGSVFNCRQRGNLWLQLAAGRVGTFPFTSPGQQPSHPWCSVMIHLYCRPPPRPCSSFTLHLYPRVSSGLPWAGCCWQHPCLPHCHLTFYL